MRRHELLIVGGGPVGLALALALKDGGLDIALADARPASAVVADPRVLALSHGTRLTLERLGVWSGLPSTPIETIHISQQSGFGRTLIRAQDYDVPALGYVASAGALAAALRHGVERADIALLDETEVGPLTPAVDKAVTRLRSADGSEESCEAALVACAEGGMRGEERAIVAREYNQHAVISLVRPAAGHRRTAFERFTPNGPLALLPCGEEYAVVHVAPPAVADELLALDDPTYLACLQEHLGGRVQLLAVRERLRYPLGLRYRSQPIGERTVWLGNAAQTLHPVAGQGFNLALRDVWALARTLLEHRGDPGAPATLAAYAKARRLDRAGTIGFTDSLVRLFSNDLAPLRHARGAGLFALDVFPPLRHFIARRMMFGARAWP